MALGGEDRLERIENDELASLGLSPQEFFLISRVDESRPTVDVLVKGSGLPKDQALLSLTRLVELKVLRRIRERSATPGSGPKSVAAKQAARLKARLSAASRGPDSRPASRPPGSRPPSSRPRRSRPPSSSAAPDAASRYDLPEPGSAIDMPMVKASDKRVDSALDLPIERQRQILGLHDQLGVINHFELLGITPTNNVSHIRRAYHQLSRRFHPDAYYGKTIGDFKGLLTELFEAARASHDLLVSSERRDAYVERLLDIERQKMQVEEAKDREADKRKAMQAALERQREEAIEARKTAAKRAERAKRDQKRKAKMSSRLLGHEARDNKAKEHVNKAEQEIRAGNHGAAAGLFRLAMDLLPDDQALFKRWEDTLAEANRLRAKLALEKAQIVLEKGDEHEAAHFFEEAARAEPTPINLANAAAYLAIKGDARAHRRAREALEAMRGTEGMSSTEKAEIHVLCGEAYASLGQGHTAKTQAQLAKGLDPKHPRLRVLLKRTKVG